METEATEETEAEADVDGDGDKPDDARTDSFSLIHYQHTINYCGRREMIAFDKGDEECDRY